MRSRRSFLLAAAVLALDQGTKAWAGRTLPGGGSRSYLGGLVRLTLVHNPGGAFGLFPEHSGAFIAVSAVVVAALAVVPRVPMAHRSMAATSLLSPLMPSAFARLPSPKRKENNHVAT